LVLPLTETAFAKINLALHIRQRRADGYHELETLFAFVDRGDRLTAQQSDHDELILSGEFAPQLTVPFDNIVSQALGKLPRPNGLKVALEKNLPVAAGLGGGSADAGAIFRLVRDNYGLPADWQAKAAALGADVPACVASIACIGRGTGTQLEPVENDLAGTSVLLVNPRVPLATGPVFASWDGQDRGALPQGPASQILAQGRNDLETPAISLCPEIAEVLGELAKTSAFTVRMSGSGATCFALYTDGDAMRGAAHRLAQNHPEWWLMQGALR